jgi:hypothetical protein
MENNQANISAEGLFCFSASSKCELAHTTVRDLQPTIETIVGIVQERRTDRQPTAFSSNSYLRSFTSRFGRGGSMAKRGRSDRTSTEPKHSVHLAKVLKREFRELHGSDPQEGDGSVTRQKQPLADPCLAPASDGGHKADRDRKNFIPSTE